MREVYTDIQLNCYWYPPWKTGALRQSRPLLLTPTSQNFSEDQTQMKDGQQMDSH